jgi:hypothetical protein
MRQVFCHGANAVGLSYSKPFPFFLMSAVAARPERLALDVLCHIILILVVILILNFLPFFFFPAPAAAQLHA